MGCLAAVMPEGGGGLAFGRFGMGKGVELPHCVDSVAAALEIEGTRRLLRLGPAGQVSIGASRVSTHARIGWFAVERGRCSRTFSFSTSTLAAS